MAALRYSPLAAAGSRKRGDRVAGRALLGVLLAFALMLAPTALFAAGYLPQKVVYHVNYDDPADQAGALRNIQNHIDAVGADKLDLQVVLHGDGLALLLDPVSLPQRPKFRRANATAGVKATIDALKRQGVSFKVCASTIKARGLSAESDLYDVDEADLVPSGIAEIARLQGEGYTYIKP